MRSRTLLGWEVGGGGRWSEFSHFKPQRLLLSAKFISACESWKKSALASRDVCDVHEFGLWQTTGEREAFALGAQ